MIDPLLLLLLLLSSSLLSEPGWRRVRARKSP